MYKDYYTLLGVSRKATAAEIKEAYRTLGLKYHPDRNPLDPNATQKFQAINEANEVLSDPRKRKEYDMRSLYWEYLYNEDADGSMYGNRKRKGFDYGITLKVTLTDAAKGHRRTVKVEGRQVDLIIPAGVQAGKEYFYPGAGGLGRNGGENGGLYVMISLVNDSRWSLHGKDLHATAEIDLYTALLGGKIVVETLDGKVKIDIKPDTQNGTKFKLAGKGFPGFKNGATGDFYVTINVRLPCNLTVSEKKRICKLAGLKRSKKLQVQKDVEA